MEDLQKKIKELEAIVQKQTVILAKTGQQVLDLQLSAKKKDLNGIPDAPKLGGDSGLITQEDVNELVGELQGQLDFLELRTIRRGINLAIENEDGILAPLPDADGEEPATFPKTLKEFKQLSDSRVMELSGYYQLLPDADEVTSRLSEFSQEELYEIYDSLARYLGIKYRKIKGNW